MKRQRGFVFPPALIAFGLKYGVYLIAGLVIVAFLTLAVKSYNGKLREQGRQEIQVKWDAEKLVRAEETAKLVQDARDEERAKQKGIQDAKDQADAKLAELQKRSAAFERDNGRLRVSRANLCKPSVPRSTDNLSGNPQAAGNPTDRAGAGEIDLDDVARAVGNLGRDLDAANIRIVELIGVAEVCRRK